MKTKILSAAVLSIIILPLLMSDVAFATGSDADCASLGGTCQDISVTPCASGSTAYDGQCLSSTNPEYVCCIPNSANQTTQTNTITPTTPAGVTSITLPNPLKSNNIPDLINNIVTYIIGIATIILPLVIIYAAYLLMTTGGDIERAILGRKAITYAVVGYILILISKGVAMIVANILGAK